MDEKIWRLEKETELRLEIDDEAQIQLESGTCEMFGSELCLGLKYVFRGPLKLCVFTFSGCTLKLALKTTAYVGRDTPTLSHVRLFNLCSGRILILGPRDCGKSALCYSLANWNGKAALAGLRNPSLLVDLNGSVSLPGTLSATQITMPLPPNEPWSSYSYFSKISPIVYYYGHNSPLNNQKLYNSTLSALAKNIDSSVSHSSIIIDSPAEFSDPKGASLLDHAISELKVDVICVIGHERLYSDLLTKYPHLNILKLAKSGGVVSRDEAFRRNFQLHQIKQYFYGTKDVEFLPFSQSVSFNDLVIRRVDEGSHVPSSALPIGHERKEKELKFVKVECGDILLHSVLAVSHLPLPGQQGSEVKIYTAEEESKGLLECPIQGFIYVSEVDEKKRRMTILSPVAGRLPLSFVIMGSLKWME